MAVLVVLSAVDVVSYQRLQVVLEVGERVEAQVPQRVVDGVEVDPVLHRRYRRVDEVGHFRCAPGKIAVAVGEVGPGQPDPLGMAVEKFVEVAPRDLLGHHRPHIGPEHQVVTGGELGDGVRAEEPRQR
ncbi:hypothetical protein ACFQ1S_11845, partial [Kibdelosporangium lantanae]